MYAVVEHPDILTELVVDRLKSSEEPFSGIYIVCQKDLIELDRSVHEGIERNRHTVNHRERMVGRKGVPERISHGVEVIKIEVRHQ